MTLETEIRNLLIDADYYRLPRLMKILQEYLITLGFEKAPVKYFLVVCNVVGKTSLVTWL